MVQAKLDRILPYASLVGVFGFFLFDGFFTSPFWKYAHIVVCIALAASDLIFRFAVHGFKKTDIPRYIASCLGLLALGSFWVRTILDLPPKPGVPQELTWIPRIREFLLVLTVVFSISFLAYVSLLELGRKSLEAQSILSDKKKNLLQSTIFGFLMLMPVLVAINYIAVMRNYNFDLSSKGKFSLSPISKNLIKNITENIELIAFYPRPLEADGPAGDDVGASLALSRIRPDVEIMLSQYRAANPKIQYRFINADVELDLLTGMGQVSNGMILVRSPRKATPNDLSAYNEEKVFVREQSDLEDLERKLTAAIINVTSPKRKVYFTSSHGERYGIAFRNLRNEQITNFTNSLNYLNFQINELGFAEGWPKSIPDDADLLIIAGPTVSIPEEGRKAILDFIFNRKGKVFITAEPKGNEDFSWLLEKAGVRYSRTILSQENTRPNIIVAKKFPDHPISELLPKKELGIVYPFGGSVDSFTDPNQSFTLLNQFILESGFGTFEDPQGLGKPASKDITKNYKLGVVLQTFDTPKQSNEEEPVNQNTPKDIEKEGRVVFYAGTSWITDQFIGFNMNKNLALSSITWLYQNSLIYDIPPKKDEIDTINLTDNQKILVWLLGMFLYPGAIIGIGSYIVIQRRRQGEFND